MDFWTTETHDRWYVYRVDARLIRISIRARIRVYAYICTYTRSCSRYERDRGHTEGLITRRVYTRATIGSVEGHRERGEGPAEPIKQVPDLSLSPSSSPCPFSSPRHAAAFPRAENARPVPGIQSERQHHPSLPRPPFPLHPTVISSTRSPGLCQARPGLLVAVYHRPFVCPSPRPSAGWCIAPRRRRCSVVGHEKVSRGFRYLSILENKCEITDRARAVAHNVEMHLLMARLAPGRELINAMTIAFGMVLLRKNCH